MAAKAEAKTFPNRLIYRQNVSRNGRHTYSIRWIEWSCPFCRISTGCQTERKTCPKIVTFETQPTDIYNQNFRWDGKYTYWMRWIEWHHPFSCIFAGYQNESQNVLYREFLIPACRITYQWSKPPSGGFIPLFDELNPIAPSIPDLFPKRKQKRTWHRDF